MNLAAVLLLLSCFACVAPLALRKRIGSVYLVPVFLPDQKGYISNEEIADNRIDYGSYMEPSPIQRIVVAYSPTGTQFANKEYYQFASHEESVHDRQRRSPVAGRRGGGGGGRGGGGGGGGGSSGSWSQSSSSASSGSWGSGQGGGRGSGKGKGYGK